MLINIYNYNLFIKKNFRVILNGKMLWYSGLSWKCQRQYLDKNNSLGFLVVNEEQSNQARKKTHIRHGKTCLLTRIIRTEVCYKLLTLTRLERNFKYQFRKNSYGSIWYFSMLYDNVSMLFFIPTPSCTYWHTRMQQRSY